MVYHGLWRAELLSWDLPIATALFCTSLVAPPAAQLVLVEARPTLLLTPPIGIGVQTIVQSCDLPGTAFPREQGFGPQRHEP